MAKEKKRRSLIFSILRMSVIPVICLGIILTAYSQNSVREGMSFEVGKSLSGTAHNLISMYNMIDAGEFSYEDGKFVKGETDLTSDYRILDDIKNDTGADVTIFYGKERMLTTLVNESGDRLVGTEASQNVQETVLKNGEEYFSESVDVNGIAYFGYYVPIRNDDGKVIGISFAGKSVKAINLSMRYMVQGNVIICIFVILLAGFICQISAQRMITAIHHIKEFLSKLAHGDFSHEISEDVMKRRDELADMGEYAVTVGKSLDAMVSQDPLTGLLNRRACMVQVEKMQNEDNFILVMGDIDFFKNVNDNYGHKKGDEVLCFVADSLSELIQEDGFASRWGGEEFLLGFQGKVEKIHEKLQNALDKIRDMEFEHEGKTFHVSMTFGVASYREGETFDEIVRRADELLYYGKENGRDQIVLE